MEKYVADDDVIAFRWELSSRYPHFDICNLYAEADLYGLGKGVYPKDKTPRQPVHPHCLCHLAPIFAGEIDGSMKNREKFDGEEYINSLTKAQKTQILGACGHKQYENGTDWRKLVRNYSPDMMKNPFERDIINVEIKGFGEGHIPRDKLSRYALNPNVDPIE